MWTETEEGEDGYAEDGSQHAVARSYEWLVAVLTHLSGTHASFITTATVVFPPSCKMLSLLSSIFRVVDFLTALQSSEGRPRASNTYIDPKIPALY